MTSDPTAKMRLSTCP